MLRVYVCVFDAGGRDDGIQDGKETNNNKKCASETTTQKLRNTRQREGNVIGFNCRHIIASISLSFFISFAKSMEFGPFPIEIKWASMDLAMRLQYLHMDLFSDLTETVEELQGINPIIAKSKLEFLRSTGFRFCLIQN